MRSLVDIEPGQELDDYRLESTIAQSPMASVFRATDLRDGKEVAIKIPNLALEEDPVRFGRFQREEEIGTSLDHPNVMRIFADRHHSRPYIVMEWCNGHLLRQILDKEGKLPPEKAVHIALGILAALEYIHNRGIIHRDLKPENIMVDDRDHIKLIDFGIASLEGAKRLTYTGYSQALGTPEYISPEQVKGKRGDVRADLYALGVMLYEMLTGRTPFSGPSPLAIMNDRLMSYPVPPRKANPNLSPQLEEVLYRALEREPKNRYRSAHDFAWDLEHLDQVGIADRQELTNWKKPHTEAHRNALLYSLLALIPIIALLAVLFLTHHHQ
ncbi:MAG TPA: serine/threonine-protein kinase [Acidobacteriaceae bacterium]|jgi:serine/threonine-protein kinase|nr:serine/threonine-protein kinase [Acidobacteriaceae bacterium]